MTTSMTIDELRAFMSKHNIPEPEGTGAKGKVLKKDLLQAVKDSGVETKGANKETKDTKAAKPAEKAPSKPKSKTANLKLGDVVHYVEDGKYDFEATVTGKISSVKVVVTALTYVDEKINPDTESDLPRKFMTTISSSDGEVVAPNTIKISVKGEGKAVTITAENVGFDDITNAITDSLLKASGIAFTKK